MSNWLDDFVKSYKTYTDAKKCLEKNGIDKQAICLLKLNAPKKKKRKRRRKR